MATPYNRDIGKKEQIEQMFDAIAPRYDFLNRLLSMRIDTIWRKKLVKRALEVAPTCILDVACGTGDLSIMLAKKIKNRVPEVQVVGLDLSSGMVAMGKKKPIVNELGIELLVGDAEKLPFENQSFDLVTCAFGVRNFGNLRIGLSEIRRVLKPNGTLLILEFSKSKNPLFRFYFKHILPTVGGWISKDKRAYDYLPRSVNEFLCGEKFVSLLGEIGFKEGDFKTLTGSIATIYQARR